MKSKKVYGIRGLLEWHGTVDSNGVRMKVDFTNGSVTSYGVAPATFTTSDELTQHILENSEQFKSGRISVVQVIPIPGTEEEKAEPKLRAAVETIEVADKTEAIEWLKEHYPDKGYTSVKLRTKTAFDEACKECGVEFKF